ncbi:hypothetical protein BGW80DRAFT_1285457 [Lactifluus volemus]|nr:hypothetical protein BGW80DRAFT_1285457 [Lactifluus volemus]
MPSVKLLFTLLSLAVFNISFNPLPTYALTLERDHMARSFNFAHAGLANKKRDGKSKRCRHRAGSGQSVSSSSQTPDTAPTSTPQPQPPAAKTTSSPVATHSPAAAAPASNGNRKVGLAWSNHEEGPLVYNWQFDAYPGIVDPAKCGLTYMAMVHDIGSAPAAYSFLASKDGKATSSPDIQKTAISVDDAVQFWYKYMLPLNEQHGYTLVSPAVTCTTFGLQWLQEFMNRCQGCRVRPFLALIDQLHKCF